MKPVAIMLLAAGLSVIAIPARAADKTHQQIMAEIRMLQEQQQQLAQTLGALADTLKTVTAKLDEQAGVNRKAFADQRLVVDGITDGVRILREKADDTNVRLSTMRQEIEALRQTIGSMPAPGGVSPETSAENPTGAPAGTSPMPPSVSPDKAYQAAFSDYTAGQYDLAIEGFNFYLKNFPRSVRAPEAQLNIGNAYYALGNYREAIAAFQKVISDYAASDSVPAAYYKLGLSYEGLKQLDLARRAYETVIKNHPNAMDAQLARQRLDSLNRKELLTPDAR